MQRFAPPIVGGYVQPLDGTRLVGQLGDFFFYSHAMYQVGGSLFRRQSRVQIWRRLGVLGMCAARNQEDNNRSKNLEVR